MAAMLANALGAPSKQDRPLSVTGFVPRSALAPAAALSAEHRLKVAWQNWIASLPATDAFSLAYNNILKARPSQQSYMRKVSIEQVHADVHRFLRNVHRELLGSHYTNPGLEHRRIAILAFIENAEENVHVHGRAMVPLHRGNEHEEFPGLIERLWRDQTGGYGSVDVQPIRDEGWAFYMSKKQQFGAALENPALFIFSQSPAQGKRQP